MLPILLELALLTDILTLFRFQSEGRNYWVVLSILKFITPLKFIELFVHGMIDNLCLNDIKFLAYKKDI